MSRVLKVKEDYPRSSVIPYAEFGIMRLNYRDGNKEVVANQFARLNTTSVPDSLKFHAYYYQGETHLNNGEYGKAIQLFEHIPEKHPEYLFAKHSQAIAQVFNKNLNLALEALEKVIRVIPKTKAEEEIINRSYVFMGYIYYEDFEGHKRVLSKAVSALRQVPATSFYYIDALLGLAWCGLSASQWNDCRNVCENLKATTPLPIIHCEADLLVGYCDMVDKKYVEALDIFRDIKTRINKIKQPRELKKNSEALEYDDNRSLYYEVAAKVNDLALTRQSSIAIKQIDSLKVHQMEFQKKIYDYFLFAHDFKRKSLFARSIDNVRDEAEYAIIKLDKIILGKTIKKKLKNTVKKADKIESEIEKLQEELEDLK